MKCFIPGPCLGSVNAAWALQTKATETKLSAIAFITGMYWVLKLMMGLGSPVEASVTVRLKLYFPAMYAVMRRVGRRTPARDIEPTITLQMSWKNSALRSSARSSVVSSAVDGSRTWLKRVRA